MNENQPPFAMNSASLETAKEQRKKERRIEARRLTPNELQEKLDSLGAGITRESLEELCRAHPSARELCFTLAREPAPDEEKLDWIWACIAALWETWFPHIPSTEAIDETMQSGYARMMANDSTGACHEWICCWKSIQSLIQKFPIHSIEEFDTRFVCTQMLFNWVQDFEMELGNAALADRSFNRVRKEFCEEILTLLDPSDENTRGNMTRAIAECLFNMGDQKAAFSLYKSRLEENPRWGWGWVGWADLYSFSEKTIAGFRQAEQILLQALSVPGVSEAAVIRERLGDVREEMAHHSAPATAETAEPARGSKRKVGRNEPCPCGSGLKYKRCHGK